MDMALWVGLMGDNLLSVFVYSLDIFKKSL